MTNSVRVLVVDDERPGRDRLRRLVTRTDDIELAGVCSGGAEAIAAVRAASAANEPVQVLLLDIQMPEVDGFGVLAALVEHVPLEHVPAVIVVTAYDEYAIKAFEARAIDYLLKPFSDERFAAAIDRAIRHVRAGQAQALMSRMQALLTSTKPDTLAPVLGAQMPEAARLDKMLLKGLDRGRLLPVEQISWIEAEGMYVRVHSRDGHTHLHRALLGTMDRLLDPKRFVRIHRSTIVNIDLVDTLRQDAHGDYVLQLRDRTELRVGRRFRQRLQARLGQPL